jgi:hypothetical protein
MLIYILIGLMGFCQRFRFEQSTGGSTPVVYLFDGGRSRAKNVMVMQWHMEQEGYGELL